MDINRLIDMTIQPEIFEKSTSQMWTDGYISRNMLKAHLDPNTDAASRKPYFMDDSVKWIKEYICSNDVGKQILDLGCGPGLYTSRLARLGFNSVTGVDFSRCSIEYAERQAAEQELNINYVCQDYLSLDYTNSFDVAVLIYCDFGVLNEVERNDLLSRVYTSLKPQGKFIFDIFTPHKYRNHVNSRTWTSNQGGFWRPTAHLCLDTNYWYAQERVHLQQTIVLGENEDFQVYNIWDQTFTIGKISSVLKSAGFEDLEFYTDVTGREYEEESDTISIIAKKK